jgi:hypothetical protein
MQTALETQQELDALQAELQKTQTALESIEKTQV